MTITVHLENSRGEVSEFEAEAATEYLSARGVWWRQNPERASAGVPFYEPSAAPYPQRSKHEWAAQLSHEDSYSMGEGARRDLLRD